jgi:hypothetical protein
MMFPTTNKVEELYFFNGMEMRIVPGVKFKVDKWNPHTGAKANIASAWFRISGIPTEKRIEKKAAMIASLVGIPLEVAKNNLKIWDYVRVRLDAKMSPRFLPRWRAFLTSTSMILHSRGKFRWRGGQHHLGILLEMLIDPMKTTHHQRKPRKERGAHTRKEVQVKAKEKGNHPQMKMEEDTEDKT